MYRLIGVEMKPCGSSGAHPVLCLDVCNGYAGRLPGYDQFTYRYYFSGDVGTGELALTALFSRESFILRSWCRGAS